MSARAPIRWWMRFASRGSGALPVRLRRAYHDGADRDARRDMALASLFGGLALANAGLGVVHGFAAPLGGQWKAPHGALCAALLPHGMAANVAALRARAPQHPALERYAAIARLLTGRTKQARRTASSGCARSAPNSTSLRCAHGGSPKPICPA